MSFAKNYQKEKKCNVMGSTKRVYRPRPPFRSVEGIESPAWERLSPNAVWALMELYKRFNGKNRGSLTLPYREVNGKMANGTLSNSIWELRGYGFVDVKRFGRLERNNSVYALSDKWRKLSENSKKLHKIEKLLKKAEKVGRIVTPKKLSENQKFEFRTRRRQMVRKIRKQILKP
jgi:hypothetical protein